MDYLTILSYFLRIIVAGACGGLLGYERTNRGKEAGIRTHVIVSIASALMMLISKYGFNDLAFGADFKLDPSRVASQIVSGIGFLGAGIIFIQKNEVRGLTTAAGVWATSGIGMAIGCGMYAEGIFTSVLIFLLQILLHKNIRFMHRSSEEHMSFVIDDSDEALAYLKNYMSSLNISVTEISTTKHGSSKLDVHMTAVVPSHTNFLNALDYDRNYIYSIDV